MRTYYITLRTDNGRIFRFTTRFRDDGEVDVLNYAEAVIEPMPRPFPQPIVDPVVPIEPVQPVIPESQKVVTLSKLSD